MAEGNSTKTMARRTFLAGSAATAFTIVRPSQVRGTQANSAIEIAMLGCGGRGNWISPLFVEQGGYKFVACADYYQDRVDAFGEKYNIPADRRYTTLSAYRKLMDAKFDAVVIETPPWCHPEHAAAAVDAGKHVFLAKPIAVDVPGCRSIAESGKKASAKKLVFLVDFQTRANKHFRDAAKRVHRGDIGRLVCAEARYPWAGGKVAGPKTPEERLKLWYCTKAFSGDHIVEQAIHALDLATWFINADPIKAYGTGGSKGLRLYGDIFDHFNCVFHFPDEVILSFYSVQAVPKAPNEIPCRVFGSEGIADVDYFRHVYVRGTRPSSNTNVEGLFTTGAQDNIREFQQFVREGQCDNPTVAPSVRSNLTCILGRTAGYKGGEITWKEMMDANERWEPDLKGLKA